MLSHDNVTWTSQITMHHYGWHRERLLTFLPMSHIAACIVDCFSPIFVGSEVHFADENVLKGTFVSKIIFKDVFMCTMYFCFI